MEFRDVLEFERENADSTIQKCGSLLQHLPKGKLSVQTKNGRKYYRKSKDGIQTNLKNGDRQIELLAGRRVAEIALQNASYDKTMLDKIIKSYKTYNPNEITESLSPAYHNITPDIIEAMGFPYLLDFDESTCAEELHPEHLTQTDSSGNKRRSKSELSINAVYHELNMKPIYEYELVLPDGFVLHPDFTIWSIIRRLLIFHEHVGNVGDPKVLARTLLKFEELVKFGYYPFDRFIFTFEDPDGNINLQEIKMLIQTFMR